MVYGDDTTDMTEGCFSEMNEEEGASKNDLEDL
jgi:hypothetical protein